MKHGEEKNKKEKCPHKHTLDLKQYTCIDAWWDDNTLKHDVETMWNTNAYAMIHEMSINNNFNWMYQYVNIFNSYIDYWEEPEVYIEVHTAVLLHKFQSIYTQEQTSRQYPKFKII